MYVTKITVKANDKTMRGELHTNARSKVTIMKHAGATLRYAYDNSVMPYEMIKRKNGWEIIAQNKVQAAIEITSEIEEMHEQWPYGANEFGIIGEDLVSGIREKYNNIYSISEEDDIIYRDKDERLIGLTSSECGYPM